MSLERLRASLADRYRLERELGAGGMATVYLAEDLKHHRNVAVKVLRPELAASMGAERFEREIQVAARLQHPHILGVLDSGEADGFFYYVMPYVEGETLRERLTRSGELPVADALRLLGEVTEALSVAHNAGVVHRDIKPENILLSGRHAMVMDFGVAKAVSEASGRQQLTTAGVALGTPAYMAPEQATADPQLDHRVDIYALGVLAYEMLTGHPPFHGLTPQQTLAAHVTQTPLPVTQRRPGISPALETLIMRCLAKRPADRYQTADELVAALEPLATPSGGMTPTATRPHPAVMRRSLRGWAIAVLATVVLGAAVALGWRRLSPAGPRLNPELIAIFPFRVTSADASLGYLGEGMVDLLSSMYTGKGGPRAIDPRTTLAAWRRHGGGERAEAAGPAAARDLGAGQYLLGSIVATGSRLVLSASVARPGADGATAQARVEGPVDSLSGLLEALVGQLLVRDAGVTGERASGMSSSLEATRAYVAGRAANRRGNWNDGALNFARAIALDSSFTLAALGLTEASAWLSIPVAGLARVQELAWTNRAKLSPRDQAVLAGYTGGNGPAPHSEADAHAAWETAVSRFPDLAEAWYWLGEEYFHSGRMLGFEDHLARARRAFEMASSLDPEMTAPLYHRIEMAAMRHDTAEAERLFARVVAHDSTSESRAILQLYVADGVGDSADMSVALDRFGRTGNQNVYWAAAYFIRSGRGLGWIDTVMSLGIRAASTAATRELVDRDLLTTRLDLGRPLAAVADARRAGVWDDTTAMAAVMYWGAPRDAALGTEQRQSRLALSPAAATAAGRRAQYTAACLSGQWSLLQESGGSATPFITVLRRGVSARDAVGAPEANPTCLTLLEAMQAVRERRPDAGALVVRLDSLLQTGPPGTAGVDRPADAGLQAANLLAARLLEHVGQTAAAFRAAGRMAWSGSQGPQSPQIRELGRLASLAGEREAAMHAYRHYLVLHRDAEPGMIPQRDSVERELAALGGEGQ